MSWIYTAVIAVSSIYQVSENKKMAKKARKNALEDEARAKRSEVFAETEGLGLGNLGKVSLQIDEDITDLAKLKQSGSTRVRL